MSTATRSTDLHKEIKISHLHNLLSANWTYLAGNFCRKRKFWPDHLWIRPSFPRPQTIRWMSNMRWISSPNSYRNIEICSKHSWKKGPFNWHSLRSPIQHQDPNKSNLGCFQTFWNRRTDTTMLCKTDENAGTMHLTKGHVLLGSIIALFRFAPTVLLVRKLLTWVANRKETLHNPSSRTPMDIQTTTCFSLKHAMRILPFAKIKEAKETPTLGLTISFFALDVLQIVYGHKIYRSTQGNQNFTSP